MLEALKKSYQLELYTQYGWAAGMLLHPRIYIKFVKHPLALKFCSQPTLSDNI